MRKIAIPILAAVLSHALCGTGLATNGDTLIGVAPTARAMGGVGVAEPQDAISAIFANPAAMCVGPYCPGSQSVFAGTFFIPTVKARVTVGTAVYDNKSAMKPFMIPAVGISSPLTDRLRFGIGAYGISGMGVDYRNKQINLDPRVATGNGGDVYTQLQVMKFAPNLAYMITPDISVGASVHLVYGSFDLGQGTAHNYTVGGQVGAIYRYEDYSFGINYTTPEKITHDNVYDFDGDGQKDSLALESPQSLALGVAFHPEDKFLFEADFKWLNWSGAAGYRDFDWRDQWILGVGIQYKGPNGLIFRAGYNYGNNPVKTHDNFVPNSITKLQGKSTSTLGYEYLRTVGFPAVAEQHVTCGIGYQFTKAFSAHIGYKHSFGNSISERSADGTYSFSTELTEDSVDVGLIWNTPRLLDL